MLLGKAAREFIKGEASKNGAKSTVFPSALVNLREDFLFADEDCQILNEDTKEFNYPIFIKYQPTTRKGYAEGMHFILGSSLLPESDRTRLVDFADMKKRAENTKSEEGRALRWILENTDICEEHFRLARVNCGIRIYINFDMLAYAKKINPDWENYPSYASGADIYINSAYAELRIESLNEKAKLKKRKRDEEIKEAKRCQQ